MKKTCMFLLNGFLLFFSFTCCTIEREKHSPGDFMDCSHEANIFSAKFNGDIVFTSYDQAELHMSGSGFSAIGRKGLERYHISAFFDTLFPGLFLCDDFNWSNVSIAKQLSSGFHVHYFVDCNKEFRFKVEDIDFEKGVLCLRVAFTAVEVNPVYQTVIEGGEVIVVEDGFLSFK